MMVFNIFASDLKVTIGSERSLYNKTQVVSVWLRYDNTGKEIIHIFKWCLPDKELSDPLFQVTCDNASVDYVGPMIKRRTPTNADVISLAPGKAMQTLVQLSPAYDMTKSCNYSIQYYRPTESVIFSDDETLKNTSPDTTSSYESDIKSNIIQLTIEGRPNTRHQ
ncbi:unnamed protein product [Rotaria sp. Silwood1]|nr:unnamed protein product [Rotaria sp. Silwood1]CAF4968804.1 unnamed protein product [Rotaria sp. Silwood1]